MQNTSYSYKPKVQKDIRKYENTTQILKKSSSKGLNSSTPHAQERGNTNSPQAKSNNNPKSLKNYQNLLSQLDMNSNNKDSKTYIQVNKILNPAKNDFLKQYLKNTLINAKKSKKDPDTAQSSATKEQKSSIKDNSEVKENYQREGVTYSKLDVMLGNIAGRLTTSHKAGHIDRNDIMKSFVSPKGVVTHSRANKSGIITSTINKEGNETFTYKPISEVKDVTSSKANGRKSVENPYFYTNTTAQESHQRVNPQKILAELEQNFNYTPTKLKRSITTKAREETANVLSQNLTRKAEDPQAKKFKFQEENSANAMKLEEVELSPIRPSKRRQEEIDRRIRQIAQSHTNLDVNSQTNTSSELNLRKSQGLSKQEEKDQANISATNTQGSKKISVNQMNAHMYPTIVKQINLVTANTPMAFGKPPLPINSTQTPQNTDILKSANALNVQTVKESKRFEFPAYLNNFTCEHKKLKDSPSSSFTLDNSRVNIADKNKLSFTELIPETYKQTAPGQRTSTDDSRQYKIATEVSESLNVLKGYKTEVPQQAGKYNLDTGHISIKQSASPGKKGFGANFETHERSKTPTCAPTQDHTRNNLPFNFARNQIAPQSCKYTPTREGKGFSSSANHSFHNLPEDNPVKKTTETMPSQKDFFISAKEGNQKNALLNTNPVSSEASFHNNTNNTATTYQGTIYTEPNGPKNEYEYRSSKDREYVRRNLSEEKENICTENDGYQRGTTNHSGAQGTAISTIRKRIMLTRSMILLRLEKTQLTLSNRQRIRKSKGPTTVILTSLRVARLKNRKK